MIRGMIFDLDGTLVQTEKLKALSYAKATLELCGGVFSEAEILEGFKDFVGLSRKDAAEGLIERFRLLPAAQQRMDEFGVTAPWQAFVQVRLRYYSHMLEDVSTVRDHQWAHNVALVRQARRTQCKTGLATMSHCEQTQHILQILSLYDEFDFIATRDDVEFGKPDPEIYQLVGHELGFRPHEYLVIEDSPNGVKAAMAAGMHVIAVATPLTREGLHKATTLDPRWIVDEPTEDSVIERVQTLMAEQDAA